MEVKTITPADAPHKFCSVMRANLYEALHCEGAGFAGSEGPGTRDKYNYVWTNSYNQSEAGKIDDTGPNWVWDGVSTRGVLKEDRDEGWTRDAAMPHCRSGCSL